jgi:hypothetical protein
MKSYFSPIQSLKKLDPNSEENSEEIHVNLSEILKI